MAKQAMRPTMQPARMPCTAAKLRPVPSARAASPLFPILGHMHGGSQASGVLSDESRCRETASCRPAEHELLVGARVYMTAGKLRVPSLGALVARP